MKDREGFIFKVCIALVVVIIALCILCFTGCLVHPLMFRR